MINTFWQVLKDKHGLAPKTINNIRSVFIIMMKEAVSKGLIERNPVEMTISRTVDKKKQEAGELLALTINEVYSTKIVVKRSYNESYGMTTTKTSEERVGPITDEIYRYNS